MRTFDCLVAGDANVDLLVTGIVDLEIGTEKLATDLSLVLGGSSSITAHNLSRLGAKVSFAGVVGEDLFGRFVEENLLRAGVNVTGLMKDAKAKTGVTIWHSLGGQRAGVTYPGTIALLTASNISDALLSSARHLHIGAYFLQTGLHDGAPELFARAKRLGLTTSLDCNWDPADRWNSNLRELLKHTDIFFPNEDEALRLTGKSDAKAAARELARLAATVIVKRGGKGAFVATSGTEFGVPAIRVKVVDTTGAGDSFDAGFLAEFLKGGELRACADSGIRAATRSIRAVGGTAAFEP